MNNVDIMELIDKAIEKATGNTFELTEETNLIESEILDSLDSMVFILELEKATGKKFPEEDLEEEGFFKVGKIVAFLNF